MVRKLNIDKWIKLQAIVIIIAPLVVMGGALWYSGKIVDRVTYNCDIAEISPDIPIKVKEQCRELRNKK